MKNKNIFLGLFAAIIFLAGGYLFAMISNSGKQGAPVAPVDQLANQGATSAAATQIARDNADVTSAASPVSSAQTSTTAVSLKVPFIVQAPSANWNDPIFQNACEEASIAMAMGWVNGAASISPQDAQNQILDIVDFENKNFGYNTDTDVFDMQKIFQQDFHRTVTVKENITAADIISQLRSGNLVLVPAFGQALGNPNYTAPGPVAHMLVITGYDPASEEFITNDPGTRHGSGYRYDTNVLFNAIWEYPSGPNPPAAPTGTMKKAMIVVSK